VGQTGRDFRTRFNEHKRSFTHNYQSSKYALHLLEHSHTLGNMQDVMRVLQFQKKGIHLDAIERFHIHRQAAKNNHLNDITHCPLTESSIPYSVTSKIRFHKTPHPTQSRTLLPHSPLPQRTQLCLSLARSHYLRSLPNT
jgi:hypothetical protein